MKFGAVVLRRHAGWQKDTARELNRIVQSMCLAPKHPELSPTTEISIQKRPTTTLHAPDDHQDDMQPPCPPQHIFSVYVSWSVSRYSVPITPETDGNRLSAHVTSRPRPPRRLQSERKVTTQSNKWEIAHI